MNAITDQEIKDFFTHCPVDSMNFLCIRSPLPMKLWDIFYWRGVNDIGVMTVKHNKGGTDYEM